MARDFRPKDKSKRANAAPAPAPRPSFNKGGDAAPPRPSSNKPAPTNKAQAAPNDDSDDDSIDDATLLQEIKAMGGDEKDLELVGKSTKGKAKAAEAQAEDPTLDSDIRSFMKQLNFDFKAPPPIQAATPTESKKSDKDKKSGKDVKKVQPADGAEDDAAAKEAKLANKKAKRAEKAQKEAAAKAAAAAEAKEKEKAEKAKAKAKAKAQADDAAAKQKAKEAASVHPERVAANFNAASGSSRLVFEPVPRWSTAPLPKLPELPSASSKKSKKGKEAPEPQLSEDQIASLQTRGKALLDGDNATFASLASSGSSTGLGTLTASDAKFISTLLATGGSGSSAGGGTSSDRIAALTLLLQSSPMHNLQRLDTLLTMAGRKNREESGRATRALADWLSSPGGLSDRKLRYFRDQPELARIGALITSMDMGDAALKRTIDQHLMRFSFEDRLKKAYFTFLQLLEQQSHDPLAFVRKQAVTQIYLLLRDKSEQEQNLLRLLVNKLGDGERAVASKASGHLLELLSVHPNMKSIVVQEIGNLILKPARAAPPSADGKPEANLARHNEHARYYGVLSLNQTMLTAKDREVANTLVSLYFDLFEGVLDEEGQSSRAKDGEQEEGANAAPTKVKKASWTKGGKGKKGKKGRQGKDAEQPKAVTEAHAKMMAAILAGVRRAFPFAQLEGDVLNKHMATIFRITHTGTFNISIQALQLIFQVTTASSQSASSRSSVEGKTGPSKDITDRFYRTLYSSMLDPRLATTSKQAMYLNLLFKALKADSDDSRTKAGVKRLVQTMSNAEPPYVCGALFLLGELFRAKPGLRAMLTEPEDDGPEHFVDAREEEEEEDDEEATKAKPVASVHVPANGQATMYDALKREPLYSGAELTCLWELVPLLVHFHPSVALHARQLLQGERITTTADLSLHTLSHFLDRFVYRNPKSVTSSKGPSGMQPAASAGGVEGTGLEANVVMTKGQGIKEDEYVNSDKFWRKKVADVPVDQLFFHRYFNEKLKRDGAAKKAEVEGGEASSDEGEGEDEEASDLEMDDDEEEADDDDSIVIEGEDKSSDDDDDDPDVDLDEDEDDEEGEEDLEAHAASGSDSESEGEKEIWEAMKKSMPREAGDEDLMLDSEDEDEDDEDLEQFDYSDSDEEEEGGEGFGGEGDEDGLIRLDEDEEGEEDEEVGMLAEDEDDLLPFADFEEAGAAAGEVKGKKRGRSAAEEEEEEGEEEDGTTDARAKANKARNKEKRERKKRMKAAPTFASAEDFAHLLGDDEEEEE